MQMCVSPQSRQELLMLKNKTHLNGSRGLFIATGVGPAEFK